MKIGEYEQMMSYLTRPEPSKTKVADLVDDLEPGSLKDELKKNYDPSQETYEEYLQRKNLDRPFNAQDGGRAYLAGGSSRLNEMATGEPYLYTYDTPTGGKRYQAKVMGSGFSKAIRKAFPFTKEGKKEALETIEDHVQNYKVKDTIKKLKNSPNPDKPWRYKVGGKGNEYFATEAEAEAFRQKNLDNRTLKQTKLPTEDYSTIVDRIKKGETLESIAPDYDLADASRIRKLLKDNGVTYSQLTPNISYKNDPEIQKIFTDNYKKLSTENLAKKLFPEDNLKLALNKYANVRDELGRQNKIKVEPGFTDELKESFSKEPKDVQAKKIRLKRDNLIKDVSDLNIEKSLKEAKIGEGLDQAHRLSLQQVKKTNELYNVLNLGIDAPDINREIVQSYEDDLKKLYTKQNSIVNKAKNLDKIPKEVRSELSDINKQVSDVIAKTDGRLQGVHIDEFTLKPKVTGVNYINTIGMGLIDKNVKDLNQADIDLAKAIMPYQVENEKRISKEVRDKLIENKKSKGVMLGSAGDLDTAARLVKEDFQTAKKLFGKYAPQIARTSLPAIKLLLAETGIGAAFVPMDIAAGLTPKEVGLNLATLGVGVPFKDIQERAKFVEEKGLGTFLTDALNKQMIPQNIRPALNMPADFGASQDLTEQEQQALQMFETEAREPIESRREKLSKERIEKYSDPEFGFREGAMNGGIMRLGFADGPKDPKMNRRTFMKVMGGIASIPVLGRIMKPAAKVVESAAPVVTEAAKGVPPYFFNLVAKIKKFGEDVSQKYATQDREVVTKFKDYELTEDLATGEQTIKRMKVLDDGSESYYGNPLTEETYMNYKPSQKILLDESNPTGGVKKTMPEYEEGTAYLRSDREFAGDIVDESFEISDDVIQEGTKFEDDFMDFEPKKKINDK